jgi:selenocysteine lyase/cysteine desulfurase
MVAIYGLAEGLKVLVEVGVERVARHVETLATRLIDGLTELELTLITPREPGLRAGIVSWLDPHFRETATALEQHGVIVTGSAGRVRAGIHLYNDERDVDRLVAAMRELVMHRA